MKWKKKQEAARTFIEFFDQKEANDADEKLTVKDFTNAFDEAAKIAYDFREGVFYISWIMNDAEYPEEITATVPNADTEDISEISDLAELEVTEIRTQLLSISDRTYKANAFIGSR